MLTITIDWIEGTFKDVNEQALAFLRTYASLGDTQAIAPRNGYRIGEQSAYGVQSFWSSNDPRMGYHVVFNGTTLRNLFEQTGVQPLTLLSASLDAGFRLSRLDLAKDLTGQEIDGEAVYKRLKSRIAGGSAQSFDRWESEDGGETIYIGARTSKKFARLYNKAIETGDNSKLWWRLEIETKDIVANIIGDALSEGSNPNGIFDATIKKMVGSPDTIGIGAFMVSGIVPWGMPKIVKVTNREKWIAEQVISAVAKHFIDNPQSEAVAALRAMLDRIDQQRRL